MTSIYTPLSASSTISRVISHELSGVSHMRRSSNRTIPDCGISWVPPRPMDLRARPPYNPTKGSSFYQVFERRMSFLMISNWVDCDPFRALELKPNYVRALANLGISFANQGRDLHYIRPDPPSLSKLSSLFRHASGGDTDLSGHAHPQSQC